MKRLSARSWAALAGAFLGLALLLRPWTLDGPMDDDWAYLLPAKRLAETGVLKLTDWAPASQVLHVGVGALFIKIFGFHIGGLKLVMLGWWAAACALLLMLLVQEGAPEQAALLASLCLAIEPTMVACGLTFMTDVPYLALELACVYALCRGLRKRGDGWLAAGGAAAAAASLVRQIGLLAPFGAAVELRREGGLTIRRALLLFGPALACLALDAAWTRSQGATVAWHHNVGWMVGRLFDPPRFLAANARWLLEGCLTLGLGCLPLAAGLFAAPAESRSAERWANALLAGAVGLTALVGLMPYGMNAFHPTGLGGLTVPGETYKASGFFAWKTFAVACTAAGAFGAWILASKASGAARGAEGRGLRVLGWGAAAQLGPSLLWGFSFWDRYLLPVLPFVLGLAALTAARRPFRPAAAWTALGVLAAVWLAGAADYAAWNRAEAALVRRTLSAGASPDQLDAGWDWDAFYNYETRIAALKAKKPLEQINEWEWRDRGDRDLLITFEPHPETHWRGVTRLDAQPYATPLSPGGGALFLYKVAR